MGLFDAISNLFGGAPNNAGFQASGANILQPATTEQAQTAYQQNQDLIAALQAQGGLQNQSNVYNQLAQVAAGQGPNPAQAMLNQATGQNVANQAALMAGQRGAGANAGLIARQAAQQGAATQQQAAGQAATLQANQALGALGQMGGLATQQAGQQINATQAQQQAILNQIQAQNAANVQMQGNINTANAGLAGINATNTARTLGGLAQGVGSALGLKFSSGGAVPSHLAHVAGIYGYDFKSGGEVPGKAEVSGDSPKNDTVPAKLSPGEIVIPRSVVNSDDPVNNAAAFVAKELGKSRGGNPEGDFKEALKRAVSGRKSK